MNQDLNETVRTYRYCNERAPVVNSAVRTFFRLGQQNPKWREQVRDNVSATTSFRAMTREYVWAGIADHSGVKIFNPNGTEYGHTYVVGDYPAIQTQDIVLSEFADVDVAADNRALVKLHSSIQSNKTAFDGGTFLGELGSTIAMLRKPASGLRKGIDIWLSEVSAVKRKVKLLKNLRAILAELWLEHVYGWGPLVNDIRGICQVLVELNSQRERRSSANGYGVFAKTISTYSDNAAIGNWLRAGNHTTYLWQTEVIYRAGLKFEAAVPAMNSFARLLELSGLDSWRTALPTIYNLIPLSFVLDYFGNLGDILQCSATDSRDVKWVNKTIIRTKRKMDIAFIDPRVIWPSDKTYFWYGPKNLGYALSSVREVRRDVSTLMIPSFRFHSPPADSLRWLNLAALATALTTANKR